MDLRLDDTSRNRLRLGMSDDGSSPCRTWFSADASLGICVSGPAATAPLLHSGLTQVRVLSGAPIYEAVDNSTNHGSDSRLC